MRNEFNKHFTRLLNMLIQLVVPQKQAGGVYDFARKLREAIGHDSASLVHLSKENAASWKIGTEDTVILQMSGYGFDKRGAPLWLLRELEKRRKDIKNLGIFFHELYAFGPPWTSSFWLSPVQRHIARRLVELSDSWMTSREGAAQWLRKFAGDKPHAVLPVFSTIGEPATFSQVRLPRIIVFGSPGLRQLAYQAAGDRLFAWAKQESLEVHDVGSPISDVRLVETLRRNGVIQHGRMDDPAIRALMENALFGLVAYPVEYVAKSSVFAAYCAHGLCPLLILESYREADGLKPGIHYYPGVPDTLAISDADSIGQAAWGWYKPHGLQCHTTALLELIGVCAGMNQC